MSALTRVRNAAGLLARSVPTFGDSSIPVNSQVMGSTGTGSYLTEQGALNIATVLSCVKVLHDDFKVLPLGAFQGDRAGAHTRIENQPLIVTSPFGPDLTAGAGFGQIVTSLALRGNAYLWVVASDPKTGLPTQLSIIHPDRVMVQRNRDTGVKEFLIGGSTYGGDQVKHIPGTMLPGSLIGLDPVSYMRVSLMLASDLTQYGGNFFRNGGFPNVVLEVAGAGDRKRAREIRDIYESGHAGVANSHRPAVIFGGTKLNPIVGIPPENAQFLQTRQFMREEITAWFGVPLKRLNADPRPSPPKGADTDNQDYAIHTLLPLASPIEELWETFIPGGQGTWVRFGFDQLLRVSALERAQIAQIHRVTGIRNRNEIRADEGWAPTGPEGDNYDQPLNSNTSPIGGADNAPAPGGQDNPGAAPGGGAS